MRILVVDDSRAMRAIVMRAVRQAGFEASFAEAGDGVEALQVIRNSPPELVMADWNMPGMNGIDLLQNLRAEGSEVKMGFITSESETLPCGSWRSGRARPSCSPSRSPRTRSGPCWPRCSAERWSGS